MHTMFSLPQSALLTAPSEAGSLGVLCCSQASRTACTRIATASAKPRRLHIFRWSLPKPFPLGFGYDKRYLILPAHGRQGSAGPTNTNGSAKQIRRAMACLCRKFPETSMVLGNFCKCLHTAGASPCPT